MLHHLFSNTSSKHPLIFIQFKSTQRAVIHMIRHFKSFINDTNWFKYSFVTKLEDFWNYVVCVLNKWLWILIKHGLRTSSEEIASTAQPKIHSHSQMFRYGGSIFCLPHRPNFSDIFDLCLHWVSVVRGFHWSKWIVLFG